MHAARHRRVPDPRQIPADGEGRQTVVWKTIVRWALLAIAVPLAALGLRRLSESIERKRGQTRGSRILHKSAAGLDWVSGRSGRRRIGSR
jgi:hypothetical protein